MKSRNDNESTLGNDRTQEILKKIIRNPELFELLRNNPKGLAKRLELTSAELAVIQRTRVHVAPDRTPLLPNAFQVTQTVNTLTITSGVDNRYAEVSQPAVLEDLTKAGLIAVLERALVDDEYRIEVKEFLSR